MQRVRRLASVAAVAAALLALSACRSHPNVAAYIGDEEVTEAQVTEVVEDLEQKLGEEAGVPLPARDRVVTLLVLDAVCAQVSAEKGYRPRMQYPVEYVVQQYGLPADSTFVQRRAALETCLSGFPAADPVAPTEDELADLVQRAREAGVIPEETPFAEAAQQLDGELLRGRLALRRVIVEAMAGYDITVNPRYRPLEFPLLEFRGGSVAVGEPIGEGGSEAVVDRR
jgi:hypothetical protein